MLLVPASHSDARARQNLAVRPQNPSQVLQRLPREESSDHEPNVERESLEYEHCQFVNGEKDQSAQFFKCIIEHSQTESCAESSD